MIFGAKGFFESLKNLKLSQKGLVLLALPLALEILCIAILYAFVLQSESQARAQARSREIVATVNNCEHAAIKIMLSVATLYMSRSPYASRGIRANSDSFWKYAGQVETLIKDDPEEMKLLKVATTSADALFKALMNYTRRIESEESGSTISTVLSLGEIRRKTEDCVGDVSGSLNEIIAIEQAKAFSHNFDEETRDKIKLALLAILGMNVMVAIALQVYFSRDTISRLNVLIDNSLRLSQQKSLLPPVGGADEIGKLDRVFHEAAGALAKAQRAERAIVDNALDVICSLDKDLKFDTINPACNAVWGFEPEELQGKRMLTLVVPDDVEKTLEAVEKIKANKTGEPFENKIKTKSGPNKIMLWTAQWSEPEQVLYCVAHDVTAAREVERMKQEFVQMISHDLKTPLSSIQMSLDMIGRGMYGELAETGKDRLEAATRNCNQLIALINDLLDIEKMQAGKLQLELESASSAVLIEEAVETVRGFAEKHNVSLAKEAQDIPVFVDKKRMIQLLVNLMSNAVKFSPDGEVVTIGSNMKEGTLDRVEVYVEDHGRGIPRDQLERIFDRFAQVETTDATEKGGTGLGLAICKAIVEAHEGSIDATSEVGKGTRFTITLECAGP
ncbi:MAG: PAS domain S-box protein [Candidatus Melainabacteria bacterium]|jgi:PAS domain S-box-containing protein|nr:PAS domain S-box protein [Candidatus Melainabacteria bacterium]